MCLKINCSVKTPLHRPSIGVDRPGLWAPGISEFPVRKFSDNKAPGGGDSWEFLVGVSRSVPQILTRFQTKMGKIYTRFLSKTAQKPYPMGRHTYIAYIREYPPPPAPSGTRVSDS